MSSMDNPQTWAPYYNSKDCSQGFCTLYCPQWCYIIFPPPPPPPPLPSGFPIEESNLNFSPLVIALIGILATVFLLISYYIVVSKYRRNLDALRGRLQQDPDEESDDGRNPFYHAAWQIATTGLDESLIKSIAVCKYKKGDGFVEGSDCAVCLNEFREDETLRLLPKCSHAFHLVCIDTWLRSHSNCPLCRASINSSCPMPRQSSSQPPESSSDHGPLTEIQGSNNEIVVNDDLERGARELHILTNLGRMEPRDAIIEIEDDEIRPIRTTVSIGSSCQCKCAGKEDDFLVKDDQIVAPVGSITKRCRGEITKPCKRSSTLHCIMSPVSMKRSSSSRRVLYLRPGRRNLVNQHRGGNGLGWYTTGPFINRSAKSGSGPTHILIDPENLGRV